MRKTLITLGLCFAFSAFTFAQATEAGTGPRLEVDQYGQQVETLPVEITVRNGVTWFENRERGYRFWFDARVQVDFANYHALRNGIIGLPHGEYFGNGLFAHPDAMESMPGGISLRRVRFAIKADLNHNWYAEVDFSAANGEFGLQDAYIQFNGLRHFMFRVGNFKEDFSMEYTTSSRFVTMMERPMNITAFNFTRRLGFQAKFHHEDMPWWRLSGGVTGQEIDGWEIRTNQTVNMVRASRGQGPNFTGKVVLMPWATNPDQGLHFGYNIQRRSTRWFDDDNGLNWGADNQRQWNAVRTSSRNATHINRTSMLDTRWINGVNHSLFQGVELAGFLRGWRFGSEFIWMDAVMNRDLPNFPTLAAITGSSNYAAISQEFGLTGQQMLDRYAENHRFWGFYAYVGKILFGGHQRYDISQSEFTRPTRGRSWGDIEVLFRYDYLNLNNNHRNEAMQMLSGNGAARNTIWGQAGGSAHNFTFGVNYWINSNMRFMVNYTISRTDRFANSGGHTSNWANRNVAVGRDADGNFTGNPFAVVSDPGISFNTLQMRLEIAF